ncbi:hypothetical protein QBC35DRAFT_551030 [Podospora australis]|uniref:GMC oxidoreductase n=1 Tax=Podospora australis TaxID=1536484 RepID=A0AAN7AIF0_9PEZI|nr:hypothetical protein QBC35DRAFT_551030 [Podospora australis]
MDSEYDFIVVGGGTSGLVLAARLTEDPSTSILVVEAGSEHTNDPRIRTPAFWLSVLGSAKFDLDYKTKGLDGRVIPLSQGKLLGGSSAINGLSFVANSKAAVDAWAGFGNPGWDWETLEPYYKRFHTLASPSAAASEHLRLSYVAESIHGRDGPVRASFPEESSDPLPSAWVDTIGALGYTASGDPFSGKFSGGYINALSVDPVSRTRSDAATAYFEPAKSRPNLHVVTDALADKILFDTTGAVPNAMGSPKLLELSGIGNRALLKSLNIPIVVENSNVGENLQDHPVSSVSFEVEDGVKTIDALARQEPEAVGAAMQEYMTHKSGPFAVGNFTGSLLPVVDFVGPKGQATLEQLLSQIKASNMDIIAGDFTPYHTSFVHSLLQNPAEAVGNVFMYAACANVNPAQAGADIIVKEASQTPASYVTICAALCYPLSRGSTHITSSNPNDKPIIDPRYLEHPLDLEVQARFLRYAETIVRNLSDLEVAKQYAKLSALSCWHPTSTCAMLPRERGGVVNPRLCVYGVEGLRVVDSSIIPLATRGNTQMTVYAVAERAADLIKQDYGLGN